MKFLTIILFALLGLLSARSSTAVPLYEEESMSADEAYPYMVLIRERRSPQNPPQPQPQTQPQGRGNAGLTGGYTSGQGGFVRGDYNHQLWRGRNGAHLDANAYYQRNFHMPGPRQDYGGGLKLTVPFGG